MTIAAILRHKTGQTVTVSPDTSLADVANLLSRNRIGAVPVLEDGHLAGIISERESCTISLSTAPQPWT